jgi:transcriptional regulator GlxA family with amidase domain
MPQPTSNHSETHASSDEVDSSRVSKNMRGNRFLEMVGTAIASASGLFSSGENRQSRPVPRGALPLHRLRPVIERMRADLATNLDLKTLAAESGYCRNQFLRMFRTATDSTPHQFLLQLRLEKAQSLMKNKCLRIIDIAASCGFASQAQFSRVFRVDYRSDANAVSPRNFVVLSVKNKFA